MNKPDTCLQDKIDYVYAEFFNRTKRYRVVTRGAIEATLQRPPKHSGRVSVSELNRINRNLIVPLTSDAVLEIQKLSQEYDKLLTNVVVFSPVVATAA